MSIKRFGTLIYFCACLVPAMAQTSGATAPEVTSFEPVDTTDLVNLATGDFTYSIPVMSIPGAPGGAYPIGLNYHAGILYDQEASWVGLGWNLSPGQVSRAVRGIPDDYRGLSQQTTIINQSVYSYSVGIGFEAWSVGVKWDNHGGFGGEVGLSLGEKSPGLFLSYYRNGDGKESWGVGLSYSFPIGETISGSLQFGVSSHGGLDGAASIGVGSFSESGKQIGSFSASASYSQGGGIGVNLGIRKSETAGISLSSSGDISYSYKGSSRTMRAWSSTFGGTNTIETKGMTLPLLFVTLGYQKTRVTNYSYANLYGYLYLDSIGSDIRGIEQTVPYFTNSNNTNLEVPDDLSAEEISALKKSINTTNDQCIDKTFGFAGQLNADGSSSRFDHISLDFYTQDFAKPVQETSDSYGFVESFASDYVSASYDAYSVSAQGVSGVAKPVFSNQGFILPSDSVFSKEIGTGTGWRFHPYRNLYRAIQEGITGFPDNFSAFFGHPDSTSPEWGRWEKPSHNKMVFLDDGGLDQEANLYEDGYLSRDFDNSSIRSHSKSIDYETDANGKITQINVTKADGVRYIFGVIQDTAGVRTAGAAPNVFGETRKVKQTKTMDGADTNSMSQHVVGGSYAYSWNLAAVVSPDFFDNPPLGHIGEEDFGDYITFHYALVQPNFSFANPWGGSDVYQFLGKDVREERFNYERVEGTKQIWVPYLAETRTHFAVFDINTVASPRLDAQPATPYSSRIYRRGSDFFYWNDLVDLGFAGPNGFESSLVSYFNQNGYDSIHYSNGEIEKPIVCMRPGLARLYGLSFGESLKIKQEIEIEGRPGGVHEMDIIYVGTIENSDLEIFIEKLPTSGTITDLVGNIKVEDPGNGGLGFPKLKSIRLFPIASKKLFNNSPIVGTIDISQIDPSFPGGFGKKYLQKVEFVTNYSLAGDTPNSLAVTNASGNIDKGRLSLQKVLFYNRNDVPGNPGFHFDYYTEPTAKYENYFNKDPWGYFSKISLPERSAVDPTLFDDVPIQAIWSLKSITTPIGTQIDIDYESDQYTWVQDRLAAKAEGVFANGKGEIYSDPDISTNVLKYTSGEHQGQLKSVAEIQTGLEGIKFIVPETVNDVHPWRQQVVVSCAYQSSYNNFGDYSSYEKARFIVPIVYDEDSKQYRFKKNHPSLDDLSRWLWHEENLVDGAVQSFDVWSIPSTDQVPNASSPYDDNSYSSDNYLGWSYYNSPNIAGELGGGLRVSSLELSPSGVSSPSPDEIIKIDYDYTYPEGNDFHGLGSGVIFCDPPKVKSGFTGDRRVIRSEVNPYLNMIGASVHYEYVTIRRMSEIPSDIVRYHFATSHDNRVCHPFDEQNGTSGIIQGSAVPFDGISFSASWGNYKMFKWKEKETTENGKFWEIARFNTGLLGIPFDLENDYRYKLLNNTSLVGRPLLVETLGTENDVKSSTEYTYSPNFSLSGAENPILKKFSLGGSDQLVEQTIKDVHQGVVFEKSKALLIASNKDGNEYRVSTRLIDEIFNVYREQMVTSKEFHKDPLGGPPKVITAITSQLAQDYWTGAPVITRTSTFSSDSSKPERHRYTLAVTAHQLYGDTGHPVAGDLHALNMWTQEGLSLVAETTDDLDENVGSTVSDETFLEKLETQAKITSAEFKHWRRPFVGGNDLDDEYKWVQDATYGFVHESPAKSSTGWRYPPIQKNVGFLSLDILAQTENGSWMAPGQNMKYDRVGNVLEYRDARNRFSAACYIENGQLVAANFGNAQKSQVYYQGFEDEESGEGTPIYNSTWIDEFDSGEDYLIDNYVYVHSGEKSLKPGESTSLDTGTLHNAYGLHVSDSRTNYWITYFVSKPPATVPSMPAGAERTKVETIKNSNGDVIRQWWWVREKVSTIPAFITAGADEYIDDIAIYPAATESPLKPGENGYKSDASMALFGYHPYNKQVTSITDARGFTARFQYDARGQLLRTFDTKGRIKTEHYKSYYSEHLDGTPLDP